MLHCFIANQAMQVKQTKLINAFRAQHFEHNISFRGTARFFLLWPMVAFCCGTFFLCCGNLLLHMFVLQCCFRGCRVVFVACPSAFGRSRVFVSKFVLSHVASHAMPQPGSQVQGGTLRTMPSSTRSGVPVPSPLTFAPLHDQGMPAIHCGKRLLLCQ